jgi:uncharacterized protein YrrD
MRRVTEILSKPIISLYEGKTEGTVKNVVFDKNLNKVLWLILFDDKELLEETYLETSNIFKVGEHAIVVKNGEAITPNITKTNGVQNNPINYFVYTVGGNLVEKVSDVLLDDNFNTVMIELKNKEQIPPDKFFVAGKDALILQDETNPISIQAVKQKKIPKPKKEDALQKVQILSVDNKESVKLEEPPLLITQEQKEPNMTKNKLVNQTVKKPTDVTQKKAKPKEEVAVETKPNKPKETKLNDTTKQDKVEEKKTEKQIQEEKPVEEVKPKPIEKKEPVETELKEVEKKEMVEKEKTKTEKEEKPEVVNEKKATNPNKQEKTITKKQSFINETKKDETKKINKNPATTSSTKKTSINAQKTNAPAKTTKSSAKQNTQTKKAKTQTSNSKQQPTNNPPVKQKVAKQNTTPKLDAELQKTEVALEQAKQQLKEKNETLKKEVGSFRKQVQKLMKPKQKPVEQKPEQPVKKVVPPAFMEATAKPNKVLTNSSFLLNRVATKMVQTYTSEVIVKPGEKITQKTIDFAFISGKLQELMRYSK